MVQIEDTNSSFISQLKTAYLTLVLKIWASKIFHIICIFHHFNFDAEPPSPPPLVSKNYLHDLRNPLIFMPLATQWAWDFGFLGSARNHLKAKEAQRLLPAWWAKRITQ